MNLSRHDESPSNAPVAQDDAAALAQAFEPAARGQEDQAVAGIDRDGRVLFTNAAFDALTESRSPGATLDTILAPVEAVRARALLEEAFQYGRSASTLTFPPARDAESAAPQSRPMRLERARWGNTTIALLVVHPPPTRTVAATTHARQHEAKVAAALLETARAAGKARDPGELCRLAASAFFHVYPAPIVVVHILDRDTKELRLVAAEGEARPWLARDWRLPLAPESPSLLVQAAVQARTLVQDRLEMVSRFPEFEPFPEGEVTPEEVKATFARIGIRTVADVPIIAEGEVLGVIGIGSTRETVNEDSVRLLELLAHEIATGLHRMRLEAARTELLETTRTAHAELAEFTYNLSHDLSEDLRRVATFTEALEADYAKDLPADAVDLLARVKDVARKLQRRVRGSLELAQILRKTRTDVRPVDLEAAVEATVARVTRKTPAEDAVVHVERPLPDVRADPDALPVMLENLIVNALRFNPRDEPEVRVRAETTGRHVDVLVEDNGPGIPEEYREHVLQPFRKLPAHESDPGTGMGLAVVAKLAERCGGTLAIEDRDGEPGTRVRLRLPRGGAA